MKYDYLVMCFLFVCFYHPPVVYPKRSQVCSRQASVPPTSHLAPIWFWVALSIFLKLYLPVPGDQPREIRIAEAMLLLNQPDPFCLPPYCVAIVHQLLSCPYSLPHCCAGVDTLRCLLPLLPAVYPTAPPICPPDVVLPPTHDRAPLSQLTVLTSIPPALQHPAATSIRSRPVMLCLAVARLLLLPL